MRKHIEVFIKILIVIMTMWILSEIKLSDVQATQEIYKDSENNIYYYYRDINEVKNKYKFEEDMDGIELNLKYCFTEQSGENEVIDSEVNGKKVLAIGGGGKINVNENVKNITFPSNLKYIGDNVFMQSQNLEVVKIPNTVTYIGINAFYGCDNLTEVYIPETVTYIGNDAFESCSDSLKIYGHSNSEAEVYAMTNGLNFETIDEEQEVSNSLFKYKLDQYTKTLTITGVKENALNEDGKLKEEYINNFGSNVDKFIDIPSEIGTFKVKEIGTAAFKGLNIKYIKISEGIETIETSAFADCIELEEVILPNTLKKIANGVFCGDNKLKVITTENQNNELGVIFPESLQSIGKYSFSGTSIKGIITICSPISYIGEGVFMNCKNIEGISFDNNNLITEIPDNICYGDSNLKNVVIRKNVINIGEKAFSECSKQLIMYGDKNSYAEKYANNNGITFKYILESNNENNNKNNDSSGEKNDDDNKNNNENDNKNQEPNNTENKDNKDKNDIPKEDNKDENLNPDENKRDDNNGIKGENNNIEDKANSKFPQTGKNSIFIIAISGIVILCGITFTVIYKKGILK